MNREIKFRAWDKEGNEWSGEAIGMIYPLEWREKYGYELNPTITMHRYALMQYTGLCTESAVEIYEGDIIFNDDRPEHGVVIWSEEKAMFITKYASGGEYPLWECVSNLYDIVGNIYENPELLQP